MQNRCRLEALKSLRLQQSGLQLWAQAVDFLFVSAQIVASFEIGASSTYHRSLESLKISYIWKRLMFTFNFCWQTIGRIYRAIVEAFRRGWELLAIVSLMSSFSRIFFVETIVKCWESKRIFVDQQEANIVLVDANICKDKGIYAISTSQGANRLRADEHNAQCNRL